MKTAVVHEAHSDACYKRRDIAITVAYNRVGSLNAMGVPIKVEYYDIDKTARVGELNENNSQYIYLKAMEAAIHKIEKPFIAMAEAKKKRRKPGSLS